MSAPESRESPAWNNKAGPWGGSSSRVSRIRLRESRTCTRAAAITDQDRDPTHLHECQVVTNVIDDARTLNVPLRRDEDARRDGIIGGGWYIYRGRQVGFCSVLLLSGGVETRVRQYLEPRQLGQPVQQPGRPG